MTTTISFTDNKDRVSIEDISLNSSSNEDEYSESSYSSESGESASSSLVVDETNQPTLNNTAQQNAADTDATASPRAVEKSTTALDERNNYEEELMHQIIQKKLGFFPLKDWEEDRHACFITFSLHTEPIFFEIGDVIKRGKAISNTAANYLKGLSSILCEFSDALENISSSVESLSQRALHEVVGDNTWQQKEVVNANDTKQPKEGTSTKRSASTIFNSSPDQLLFSKIMECNVTSLSNWKQIGFTNTEDVATNDSCFGGYIHRIINLRNVFEEKADATQKKLMQARSDFVLYGEKCRGCWNEYERTFKDGEKDQRNKLAVRKCCWLHERAYRHATMVATSYQRAYLKELISGLLEIEAIENARSEGLIQELTKLLNLMQTTMSKTLTAMNSIREVPEKEGPPAPTTTSTYKYLTDTSQPQPKVAIKENDENYGSQFNADSLQLLQDIFMELEVGRDPFPLAVDNRNFITAVNHLSLTEAPASRLILKEGKAERLSGMKLFSKWEDTYLVLTWDRFLHQFKDKEDASPHVSINLATMDVKALEWKGKGGSVEYVAELREKGWGFFGSAVAVKFADKTILDEWIVQLKVAINMKAFTIPNKYNGEQEEDTVISGSKSNLVANGRKNEISQTSTHNQGEDGERFDGLQVYSGDAASTSNDEHAAEMAQGSANIKTYSQGGEFFPEKYAASVSATNVNYMEQNNFTDIIGTHGMEASFEWTRPTGQTEETSFPGTAAINPFTDDGT